jgi:hypothetical protein
MTADSQQSSTAEQNGYWQAPAAVNLGAWQADDLLARLRSAAQRLEAGGREWLNRNPLESLLTLVFGGAGLFYLAERSKNEKVHHFWDALEFVAACASVGQSNVHPATPLGKMVASALFLLGPNLAARSLHPAGEMWRPPSGSPDQEAVVSRLDAILQELRRISGPAA